MSKRLDTAGVAISGVALAVSILAFANTCQQERLMAAQLRPYVQVVDAELVEPVAFASFVRIKLRLRNFGQTAAADVRGNMDYAVGAPATDGGGEEATTKQIGNMSPGLERSVVLSSNRINRRQWTVGRGSRYEILYLFGSVWSSDSVTGREFREDWCYLVPLTEAGVRGRQLELCGNLSNRRRGAEDD